MTDGGNEEAVSPKDTTVQNLLFKNNPDIQNKLRFVAIGFGDKGGVYGDDGDYVTNEEYFKVLYSIVEALHGDIRIVTDDIELKDSLNSISTATGNPNCIKPICKNNDLVREYITKEGECRPCEAGHVPTIDQTTCIPKFCGCLSYFDDNIKDCKTCPIETPVYNKNEQRCVEAPDCPDRK
jgi:hypothetical protein